MKPKLARFSALCLSSWSGHYLLKYFGWHAVGAGMLIAVSACIYMGVKD